MFVSLFKASLTGSRYMRLFKWLSDLNIGTKVLITTLCLVTLAVGIVVAVAVKSTTGTLAHIGMETLKSTVEDEFKALELQNSALMAKLKVDMAYFEELLRGRAALFLDETETKTWTITNQVTKVPETVDIPVLTQEGAPLDGKEFTLVDRLQQKAGGTATIFQALPGKLLRVSTNVKKLDGERAVGTYIPSSSPVYKAVMAGETTPGLAAERLLTAFGIAPQEA
jgi:methyl-accepting chemotaxis protein